MTAMARSSLPPSAARNATSTIRGVGTPVGTSGGGSNVGIYVDGFYSPNPLAADFSLLKVNSIQVLKGPQGTLFGHNTTGGAILVQTADPSTDPAGEVKVSYGRYNEVRAQAYATYGISDRVAMDIEGLFKRGDGWQRNISNGQRVGDYQNWAVRLGLKADLSDNVSVLLRYTHSEVDDPSPLLTSSYRDPVFGNGAPNFAVPGEVTYNMDEVATGSSGPDQEFFRMTSDIIQGTIKADLGFANLTSYTQYRKERGISNLELDYSGVQVFELLLPVVNKTWSQEFLLTSKPGSRLQWTAGFFAFGNKDNWETYLSVGGQNFLTGTLPLAQQYVPQPGVAVPGTSFNPPNRTGGSGTNTQTIAAFLDATYEITPNLFLTAGLRYSHDSVTDAYYNVGASVNPLASISSNHLTPRAVLRYKPNDQSSIYASYTQGYKSSVIDAGGTCQNPTNIPTPQNPTGAGFVCNNVQPEKIHAYEIGYKYSSSRFSVELSGFYYDYKNLQVSVYLAGRANILNAANSKIYGLDAQVRFKLTDNFEINAGGAWTHARYTQFNGAPIYMNCGNYAGCVFLPFTANGSGTSFTVVTQNLTNVTMQRAPEFTGSLGARYKTELGGGQLALSGNLYYSSKFFFGPSGIQFPQNGYATLSLRGEWTDPSDRFTIAVYGDNVTNSRYLTQVQNSSFGHGANWSKPATFGIELGAKF